jgi:uncharacterized protein (TIGR03118 family)
MKYRKAIYFVAYLLVGFLLDAASAHAQSIGYRQTNLTSTAPDVALVVNPDLANPWGIAFLPGQAFFVSDNQVGRVSVLDSSGLGVRPGSFIVPGVAGAGFDLPTGIVADPNSSFGGPSLVKPFILVTREGTVLTWGPDARGDLPQAATQVIDNSPRGAVYGGVAILNSALTQPALAITDFQGGFINTFIPGFVPVALPGSFTDPNLPAGYAPFGIQVIGDQVYVTYALQDAAKHDPIPGPGNGVVNIFDMDGNFVKRFVTGGALNAPWGITQASANFGPFSNDILVGNLGDGTISAFDPATGQFAGPLLDGNGDAIVEVGLHGLAFRADGFGDANTLYFTSQINNENDGLFGTITAGLISAIRLSAPNSPVNTHVTITASVAAGPGNSGAPTGAVVFLDGSTQLGRSTLANGSATLDVVFAGAGIHPISAQYTGDRVFLPSAERIPLQISGLPTTTVLSAPENASPGATVDLTAIINSQGGIPTGQVAFLDGTTNLGTVPLSAQGVAVLRVNTLAAGSHSLTASYISDGKFEGSTSAGVTINIANPDFSFGASPPTATVVAGNSTQFLLTVSPAGGFAGSVTFLCAPVPGITCAFNPATVTPSSGSPHTTLTVTTSANVSHFGIVMPDSVGPWTLLFALGMCGLALATSGKIRTLRPSLLTAAAALAILTMGLAIGGCGGGGDGGSTQPNRGTATVMITAQSGPISHTTSVSITVQ